MSDLSENLARIVGLKNGRIEELEKAIGAIAGAMKADEESGIAVVGAAPKTWEAILDAVEALNFTQMDAGRWGRERAELEARIAELETQLQQLKADAVQAIAPSAGDA